MNAIKNKVKKETVKEVAKEEPTFKQMIEALYGKQEEPVYTVEELLEELDKKEEIIDKMHEKSVEDMLALEHYVDYEDKYHDLLVEHDELISKMHKLARLVLAAKGNEELIEYICENECPGLFDQYEDIEIDNPFR